MRAEGERRITWGAAMLTGVVFVAGALAGCSFERSGDTTVRRGVPGLMTLWEAAAPTRDANETRDGPRGG